MATHTKWFGCPENLLMRSLCFVALAALAFTLGADSLFAQEQGNSRPDAPRPQADAGKPRGAYAKPSAETHRFWDKENGWLFAGVAVSRGESAFRANL